MNIYTSFPNNPKEFYREHYKRHRVAMVRKKYNKEMGNVQLARESLRAWQTLDPEDKKIIIDKYNKASAAFHTRVADYLSTAVDYNSFRKNITLRDDEETPNDVTCNEKTMESENNQNSDIDNKEISNNMTNDEEWPNDVICKEVTMESETDQNNDIDDKEKSNMYMDRTTENPVSEEFCTSDEAFNCQNISPPEPNIKTARELFELVKSETGETHWDTLPRNKKEHYRKAINSLKKDYIQKYETYLRSLSTKDLYRLKYQNE